MCSSCITHWPHLRYCAALSKFVQFVKDSVRLLDVHLHLVKLYEISVKRSARNLNNNNNNNNNIYTGGVLTLSGFRNGPQQIAFLWF